MKLAAMHHNPVILSTIGARVLHIIEADQLNASRALATSTELHELVSRSVQTWGREIHSIQCFLLGFQQAVYTVFSSNFGHSKLRRRVARVF